jgi:hypothetical protein
MMIGEARGQRARVSGLIAGAMKGEKMLQVRKQG